MIRVLIVDDSQIVRDGLTMLIGGEPDMQVAGQAASGIEALHILQSAGAIDITLVDFNMPGMDGVELTSKIIAANYATKVIILTMHRQKTFCDKAFAAGVKGYLLKGEDEQELFTGIRSVTAGQSFISTAFPS